MLVLCGMPNTGASHTMLPATREGCAVFGVCKPVARALYKVSAFTLLEKLRLWAKCG